jgi:hypothetical protein
MRRWVSLIALSAYSTSAIAGPNWEIQPLQAGPEIIRFYKGVPTVELELNDGIIRLTPLPFDHGSLAFAVTAYNDGTLPANFGTENISPVFQDKPVGVFSKADLERKAKNRAFWSGFGIALLGATASAAAASQRTTYSSSFVTPRGTYRSYYSIPSMYGQYQALALQDATLTGLWLVERQLDRTLAELGSETLQITTLEPGESYAGRVVLAKVSPKKFPAQISLTITWNGESYPFAFQLAKPGTPMPPIKLLPRNSNLTDFRNAQGLNGPLGQKGANERPQQTSATPGPSPSQQPANGRKINNRVRCETCRY